MSVTTTAREPITRIGGTSSRDLRSSLPPPRLSTAQLRELDAELRRELAALDRRLASEHEDDAAAFSELASHDGAPTSRRTSDTSVRRDAVADALERLATGRYGTCSQCAEPIPYGRLLVMPEAVHCLSCGARP